MTLPLAGVRVLEVAQFTFVPSAGAVLADWGAEVVKVEPVGGDTQRGFTRLLELEGGSPSFAPIMDGPNRSKKSIAMALDRPEAAPLLHALIASSDVFLTNYLPRSRRRLGITLEDVREINPQAVYAAGSGFGALGHDAETGAYDATAFWARGGSAAGTTAPDATASTFMPAGAYGDSLGGLALAGGIAAALLARSTTGEAPDIDVSLLAVGAWATQLAVNTALAAGRAQPPRRKITAAPGNPLTGTYRTQDGRWIQLTMLQSARFWPDFCTTIDRSDLVDDPRFATSALIAENCEAAMDEIASTVASRPLAEWRPTLDTLSGPWAVVQDALEVGTDDALVANGRIVELTDHDGETQHLVANPVDFGRMPVPMAPAPTLGQHTDEVLAAVGVNPSVVGRLRQTGVIA